jgi:signal transduction histidine kinase
VAVALLTALALAGAGLVVYVLESARIDRAMVTSVERELAEFRTLQREGVDPRTGQRFANATELIETFLTQNLAEDDELLVGWYADGRRQVQGADRHRPVVREAAFREAVNQRLRTGGTASVDTRWGTVLLTVQPVTDSRRSAAFVDVFFLSESEAELRRTMTTYFVVAVLSLGLITLLAGLQAGRLLRPLRTLRDEANAITESDLSRRLPETGNDDITALTRTFNDMLARLDAAFVAQRRFLDDAGHELKTPLTVVRGHTELLDSNDPADVEETRVLLLDEIDRMSRLVEDLMMLAKADRPDFVRTAEVPVAELTASVLEKCRALGDRTWVLDETAGVSTQLDEQRITQALLQLAANAVRHTSTGQEVAIGSSVHGDTVRLWVRDQGPGVPDSRKEAIFERFERGDVHDDEGTGLGLSIVSAIALAHGGAAHVEDAVPSGARFVLTLPVRRQPTRTEH